MRDVWPVSATAALDALLFSGSFVMAECFTITTVHGTILRWTTAAEDVTVVPVGGATSVTYSSAGPLISNLKMNASIGTAVDEQEMNISYRPTDVLDNLTIQTALRFGMFDGARVVRDRWFAERYGNMDNPTVWVGALPMFSGRVGSADSIGQMEANVKVTSDMSYLDQQMPRNIQTPGCMNTLYDAFCSLSRAANTVAGVMSTGGNSYTIPWSSGTPDSRWDSGVIEFTSGNATGLRRTIKHGNGSSLILTQPLTVTPVTGDTFTATRGCSHAYSDAVNGCLSFSNQDNYRGFKNMPTADTAI